MMKKAILFIGFILFGAGIFAQEYKTAIGLRGGVTQGITLKHFTSGTSAFDFIFGTYKRGVHLVLLYEIHAHNVFDVPNLSLFYGPGGHFGHFNHSNIRHWGDYENDVIAIGVDFVLGVEYTFDEIPINIGIDIKPAFNIIPAIRYWQGGALFLRYTIR